MIELIAPLLAVLAASAASGLRLALPLLVISLLHGQSLWSDVPIISAIAPPGVMGILVSWSVLELLAFKDRTGRRLLQSLELLCSPLFGTLTGLALARLFEVPEGLLWMFATVGGLMAFVLQLVQVGWSYRIQHIPIWVICAQDLLCLALVLAALRAPSQGALIAMVLLWLAIRSSKEWHRWYRAQARPEHLTHPRDGKQDPD
jgi:hypothetical protein